MVTTAFVRSLVLIAALAAYGCAGGQPAGPPDSPEFIDGVRQRPLTAQEVGRALAARTARFGRCYQRVRLTLGLNAPSDFVARLRVGSDGGPPVAEIVEATAAGQDDLERCIVGELESLEFPPHVGETVIVDVPIRAPKR